MASEVKDIISQLPEPLLYHILSLIPVKDAAQTCLLSKRWNHIWKTLPFLDFGTDFFLYRIHSDEPVVLEKRRYLLKMVNKILLSRWQQGIKNLQKLNLVIPVPKLLNVVLKTLTCCLEGSGLRELGLMNLGISGERDPDLPSNILLVLAGSVNVLRVSGFNLKSLSSVNIKFSSLRVLDLFYVDLPDDVMEKLIAACPLLETLQLMGIGCLKNLCLNRLYKLKLVELSPIESFQMVKIEATPDLQILNVQIRVLQCKMHVADFAFLKDVTLFGLFVTENLLHQLNSQCLSLEYLSIGGGSETLEKIRISIDTIKVLQLLDFSKLVEVEISAPLLERLFFSGGMHPTFSLNVSDALEVSLDFLCYHLGGLSYDQLMKFLGYFNHFKSLRLLGDFTQIIIPKEKRDGLLSPLWYTRNLELYLFNKTQKALELVEYVLCLSPRVKSLSIVQPEGRTEIVILKFLHDKNVCGDPCAPSCKFLQSDCWRHSLTEVRVEKFKGVEDDDLENLKSFFHHSVQNLKIIDTSSPF